jgi:CheY-like chemotaxis protein
LVLANEKILIVEDEEIVVLDIRSALVSSGYQVAATANTGDDAITKAMEVRPDLVLMDIVLKGALDGVDAAEKIRALFNIPVIYLTAHTDEATLRRAKLSQPFGYIVKPFRERDLYITIEFALYRSKMERERNSLISQLRDALDRVKTLSGLLPICAACKKIRDDRGYWKQIELYLKEHCEAEFTHSYCPDCARKIIQNSEKEK